MLSWSAQLATGCEELDAEHRRLIDLINQIGHLHRSQASVQQLRDALRELRDYTVYHFRTEALLMQRHPIDPDFRRAHLGAHAGFVQRLDEFEALVENDAAAVVECVLAFMVKWLVHHVTGVDARLARDIAALESGRDPADLAPAAAPRPDALIDTVSELYEGMARRTLDVLRANQLLQQEIARRERAEEELRVSAIVFDALDEAVMVTSADNRILRVNPSFTRITGFPAEEAIGANPRIMSGGTHPPEFYRELWATLLATGKWQGEIRNRRKSGELYVEWLSIYRVRDDHSGAIRHVAVFSDITRQRDEADRIQYLANHDLLTGLLNRASLIERLRAELREARRSQVALALLFIDLDLFKHVNDALGHDVGDLLLKEAAARMRQCIDGPGVVARHGGDEFVAFVPGLATGADARELGQRLCHALRQPFDLAGHTARVSCSIGIALFPDHGDDDALLLKRADAAMYRAKADGRDGVCIWTAGD